MRQHLIRMCFYLPAGWGAGELVPTPPTVPLLLTYVILIALVSLALEVLTPVADWIEDELWRLEKR
jgi:hypothetical protein